MVLTAVVSGRRCHMALSLYPGQNIVGKRLKNIDINEELADLAFLQPPAFIHVLWSVHFLALWGS